MASEKSGVKKSTSKFKKIQESNDNISAPENTATVEKINTNHDDYDANQK